jgi:hypothetical protein
VRGLEVATAFDELAQLGAVDPEGLRQAPQAVVDLAIEGGDFGLRDTPGEIGEQCLEAQPLVELLLGPAAPAGLQEKSYEQSGLEEEDGEAGQDLEAIQIPRRRWPKPHDASRGKPALRQVPPPQLPPIEDERVGLRFVDADVLRPSPPEDAQGDVGGLFGLPLVAEHVSTNDAQAQRLLVGRVDRHPRGLPHQAERVRRIEAARRVLRQGHEEHDGLIRQRPQPVEELGHGESLEDDDLDPRLEGPKLLPKPLPPVPIPRRLARDQYDPAGLRLEAESRLDRRQRGDAAADPRDERRKPHVPEPLGVDGAKDHGHARERHIPLLGHEADGRHEDRNDEIDMAVLVLAAQEADEPFRIVLVVEPGEVEVLRHQMRAAGGGLQPSRQDRVDDIRLAIAVEDYHLAWPRSLRLVRSAR